MYVLRLGVIELRKSSNSEQLFNLPQCVLLASTTKHLDSCECKPLSLIFKMNLRFLHTM